MTANGDTEPAPDRVIVALHSPSQSPSTAHKAAPEFGQFQMLCAQATDPDRRQRVIVLTNMH